MGCGGGAAALHEVVREGFLEEVTFRLNSDRQKEPALGRAGESELQAKGPAKAKTLKWE